MKPKCTTKDIKAVETRSEVDYECGRMNYLGVDMAFIYIRGKLMFTMSEVARNLYAKWPRTTLNDRIKQMKIQWYTCAPMEIEKVLSVRGIVKLGVHCTLISKEDLDMFSSVYKVGSLPGKNLIFKRTAVNVSKRRKQAIKQSSSGGKSERTAKSLMHLKSLSSLNRSDYDKHGGNKSKARVIVKLDNGKTLERHAVNEVNKAIRKQSHVFKKDGRRGKGKQLNKLQTKAIERPIKRHLSAVSGNIKSEAESAENENNGYIPTKRHRDKMRETSSPESDSLSYDSGIASLQLDASISQKPSRKPGKTAIQERQKQFKIKEVKKKYNKIKAKKAKGKDIVVGRKRKRENVKSERMNKKAKETKKRKVHKNGCPNTITKDLIMKMDLKHMNDKDLIKSFSPLSSPMSTTTSENQPYLVKLMPVKPVWRVNSSFRFISNFQLPPSLVVQDGQLSPACSMICSPGKKPPSAHPIWKWKLGEPVISNKTVISYRMKKVRCS